MSQIKKESNGLDERGVSFFQIEAAPIYAVDQLEQKKVVCKLDRVLLPLMAFIISSNSINYAAVFGFRTDLKLTGSEFSWAVSLFYFGRLCAQYTAAYLLSRMRITHFVGIAIVLWGGVEMCLGTVHSFKGLAAVRFLLGFFEGAVSPAFVIITSNWYCRREHPVRVAYVGFILLHPEFFLLLTTERVALDRTTRDHTNFDCLQAREAFTDYRTLLYGLIALTIIMPTAIVKFSPIVIQGFGFSKFQTMLVGLLGGALAFILVWVGPLVPLYYPNARCFTGMFLAFCPMLGSLLL
ncbi:uncharacterized protein A1O9_02916 [Exophiala aquamarina CBS 119918]|uniref:Major facilitator superfamily (MFS) profile domain-containing protein n=1 Tax=Exophiala aquamarina CBS 119918 TaxID=1182545 RepID=A0A072Q0E8_9EURO|nr:uncharacterized protein A1O9_02916 [Exophiala aquamarina CBS 119918]KEF61350.1 hypothetical protein A1O9_02916 [Exophiala aquamarina CBS 119918]